MKKLFLAVSFCALLVAGGGAVGTVDAHRGDGAWHKHHPPKRHHRQVRRTTTVIVNKRVVIPPRVVVRRPIYAPPRVIVRHNFVVRPPVVVVQPSHRSRPRHYRRVQYKHCWWSRGVHHCEFRYRQHPRYKRM